jgi:pimeloyl-ACP methyl ester carboxylesterase
VAIDFLSTHKSAPVAALMLVGGLGGLAPLEPSTQPVDADLARRINALTRSGLLEDNFKAGELIGPFFMRRPVDPAWVRMTGAGNALLPPYARPLITSRSFDHTDKLDEIRLRTQFVIGSEDVNTSIASARKLAAKMPLASVSVYEGSGHLPFAEDAERFNRELRDLAIQAFGAEGSK